MFISYFTVAFFSSYNLIETDDDHKDNSDSDFAENDNENENEHGTETDEEKYRFGDRRLLSTDSLSARTSRASSQPSLNNSDNPYNSKNNFQSPRADEVNLKSDFKTNGIVEDPTLLYPTSSKSKKETKKKLDLPPLGKILATATSQHPSSNLTNNSLNTANLQSLAPLIISGTGSSSSASTNTSTFYGAQNPGVREFNILETVLPISSTLGMPAPGSAGRDIDVEWTRQVSPVTAMTSVGFNKKIKDEKSNLNLNIIVNSTTNTLNLSKKSMGAQDGNISIIPNNSVNPKFNHILLSEDNKDKDRKKLNKDLKDLIVIDGIEKRNLINSYLIPQRRSAGNIVTGHTLLGSSNLSSTKNCNDTSQSNNNNINSNNIATNSINISGMTINHENDNTKKVSNSSFIYASTSNPINNTNINNPPNIFLANTISSGNSEYINTDSKYFENVNMGPGPRTDDFIKQKSSRGKIISKSLRPKRYVNLNDCTYLFYFNYCI